MPVIIHQFTADPAINIKLIFFPNPFFIIECIPGLFYHFYEMFKAEIILIVRIHGK